MPRLLRIELLLAIAFYLSAIHPSSLSSPSGKISKARLWIPEKNNFSEEVSLEWKNGIFLKTQPPEGKEPEVFVLPTFCDLGVVLGSNGFHPTTERDISMNLQILVRLGFGHVLSIGDGSWVENTKTKIKSGNLVGPEIFQAATPLVGEVSSEDKYRFVPLVDGESCPKANGKIVPFFLKYKEDLLPLRESFVCKNHYEKTQGSLPVAFSFGQAELWEKALQAGFKVIYHKSDITPKTKALLPSDLRVVPLLAAAKFAGDIESKEDMISYWKNHPWDLLGEEVGTKYSEKWDVLYPEGKQKSKDRFSKFSIDLSEEQWLFASGSGYPGLPYGVATILEAKHWQRDIGMADPLEGNIQIPKRDPTKYTEERIRLLRALTLNSCEILGSQHRGRISQGGQVYFLTYKQNPLLQRYGIFDIESVVLAGKLVYTKKQKKPKDEPKNQKRVRTTP